MPYRPVTTAAGGRALSPILVEDELAETEMRQEEDRERAAAESAFSDPEAPEPAPARPGSVPAVGPWDNARRRLRRLLRTTSQ